jgi:hypothetical protein
MTKRIALAVLVLAALAIAAAYASAFLPGGAPAWAPWPMALGIPAALVSVMVLGAAGERGGIGRLVYPFAFSALVLAGGFAAALALPAGEAPGAALFLGLPLRAAVVIYGIGILPIVVLPIAYALTFFEQTLKPGDLERVRLAGQAFARERARRASDTSSGPFPDSAPAEPEAVLQPGAPR